jgi:hypothetical protein
MLLATIGTACRFHFQYVSFFVDGVYRCYDIALDVGIVVTYLPESWQHWIFRQL